MKNTITFLISFFALASAFSQTYVTTTPVTGLSYPVAFDWTPDGRYFITLKGDDGTPNANAKVVVYNSAGTLIGDFYDLSDSTISNFERGVLGIAIDPDFTNNHFVYVYYNHLYNSAQRLRVVRFTEVNNVGTAPLILLNITVGNINGNHVGGNIHFRPSQPDKLYVSIGDIATGANAQLKTNPFGKFLRINKDGSIPNDNPFYDDGNPATGNDDRIWSYGHRNAFDFTFSPVNDSLYSSENGANTYDELNIVTKGLNYGWQQCEGNYVYQSATLCQTSYPSHTEPISTWGAPLPAVTGVLFYSGTLMSEFDNHLLVADNDLGRIYDITLGNAPAYNTASSRVIWQDLPYGLTTLKQGTDGCVYAMKGGYTTSGNITRICKQGIGINETEKNLLGVVVSPNPSNGVFNISLDPKSAMIAEVTVKDIIGRSVAPLFKGEVSTAMTLSTDKLFSAGVYFVNVTYTSASGASGNIIQKVVVE